MRLLQQVGMVILPNVFYINFQIIWIVCLVAMLLIYISCRSLALKNLLRGRVNQMCFHTTGLLLLGDWRFDNLYRRRLQSKTWLQSASWSFWIILKVCYSLVQTIFLKCFFLFPWLNWHVSSDLLHAYFEFNTVIVENCIYSLEFT